MMRQYDRKIDTNVETNANRDYNTPKSKYQGSKSHYQGHKKPNRKDRDWAPPSYLSEYEKSVWLMNTFNGCSVKRRDYDSNEAMVRRFKKIVENAGVMREVKKREHYLTPSQKKREKKKRALKRLRKRLKIEQQLQDKEEKQQAARHNTPQDARNNRGGGDA